MKLTEKKAIKEFMLPVMGSVLGVSYFSYQMQ
jgi:hypothetical protein